MDRRDRIASTLAAVGLAGLVFGVLEIGAARQERAVKAAFDQAQAELAQPNRGEPARILQKGGGLYVQAPTLQQGQPVFCPLPR